MQVLIGQRLSMKPILLSLFPRNPIPETKINYKHHLLSTKAKYLQYFCCLALKLMVLCPIPVRPCIVLGQQMHSSAPFYAWVNCRVHYLRLTRIIYRTNGMPPRGWQTYRGVRPSAQLEFRILKQWTYLVWRVGFHGRFYLWGGFFRVQSWHE